MKIFNLNGIYYIIPVHICLEGIWSVILDKNQNKEPCAFPGLTLHWPMAFEGGGATQLSPAITLLKECAH